MNEYAPRTSMDKKTSLDKESERELIARAQKGDGDAFASLFHSHSRRVYALCMQMTGNVAEAEDLTQEAFMQVFRKLSHFRGDSAFSTWLYRVAVNTVLMKLRRRTVRQVSLDEPVNANFSEIPREYGGDDSHLLSTPDRMALAEAIRQLPSGCRRIFILHHIDGYEHREIAKLLQCSTGNSKSQLHKAKLKLREFLFGGNLSEKAFAGQGNRKNPEEMEVITTSPLPNPGAQLQAAAASAGGEL
jgi:RNA polymerase sigma-70 factor (ECF subfamily)